LENRGDGGKRAKRSDLPRHTEKRGGKKLVTWEEGAQEKFKCGGGKSEGGAQTIRGGRNTAMM